MGWQSEVGKTWARLTTPPNAVHRLARRYRSDKGTRHYERHNYARIYDPLFSPLRQKPIRLLEIGLLNSRDYRSWVRRGERYAGTAAGCRAPSLEMWSAYFPKAESRQPALEPLLGGQAVEGIRGRAVERPRYTDNGTDSIG